jgi:hypothetical protein
MGRAQKLSGKTRRVFDTWNQAGGQIKTGRCPQCAWVGNQIRACNWELDTETRWEQAEKSPDREMISRSEKHEDNWTSRWRWERWGTPRSKKITRGKLTTHIKCENLIFSLKSNNITTNQRRSPPSLPHLIIRMKFSSWLTLTNSKKCEM